jgi:ammonia channel protein AmtB
MGALDFAGGTVVHISSGFSGLIAAMVIGKRLNKSTDPTIPHNLPYVILGGALLWFGWFGFNAGSELAADGIAVVAFVTTHIAASAGLLGWVLVEKLHHGKPTVLGAISGAVAGLVAITPACAFVPRLQPFSSDLFQEVSVTSQLQSLKISSVMTTHLMLLESMASVVPGALWQQDYSPQRLSTPPGQMDYSIAVVSSK